MAASRHVMYIHVPSYQNLVSHAAHVLMCSEEIGGNQSDVGDTVGARPRIVPRRILPHLPRFRPDICEFGSDLYDRCA